jgi:hypothetical protein
MILNNFMKKYFPTSVLKTTLQEELHASEAEDNHNSTKVFSPNPAVLRPRNQVVWVTKLCTVALNICRYTAKKFHIPILAARILK